MMEISRLLVTYLINALWQVPMVAAMAWVCMKLMRRVAVSYKHGVLATALILGAVIPLATLEGPTRYGATPWYESLHVERQSETAHFLPLGFARRPFLSGMERHSQFLSLSPLVTLALGIVYLVFLIYRIGRFGWALRRSLQIRANAYAVPLDSFISSVARRCSRRFGLERIGVLYSSQVTGPLALGICKTHVIIPERMLTETLETDLYSAFCHEMAHIRRKDFLLNLIYEIVHVPISFHPVAKLIKSRIDQTREIACDEVASTHTSSRSGYARSLLRIAQSMTAGPAKEGSSPALGLFDSDNLQERIMNLITDATWMGKRTSRFFAITAALALTMACFGVSAYSFQVGHNSGQRFAGTWKAEHEGKTILLLEFRSERGTLTGSIRAMDFEMDLQGTGAVKQVRGGPLSEPMPLMNLKLDGDHLLFEFKEDDDPDSTHWRMKLIDANRADLQWIELPAGFKAKPFHLIKESEGLKGGN